MNWPAMLTTVLAAFLLLGGVGIGWTAWQWAYVGRQVSDVAVKVTATLVKYVAGLASFGGAYAAAHKDDWWFPAAIGLCTIVVWDVLEKLVDNRVKAVDKFDKAALAKADRESELRTELLTVFRRSVAKKTRRLLAKLAVRADKPSAALLRAALTPHDHLDDLLDLIAVFAAEQLPKDLKESCNFRVGLYAERAGVMTPLRAVSLNNPGYDVFSSYRSHEAAYRIDTVEKASHAVKCVKLRKTIIVEDCAEAAVQGEFSFFNENQRGYLRSMLCYYLDRVCCEDGTTAVAALVIDTDLAGHFRESDRDSLQFWLREFGARIKLELLLHSMLLTRGAKK